MIVSVNADVFTQVAYWNWKKEVNQFYYDYNKVMAEESG